jgi:hypothetical protein
VIYCATPAPMLQLWPCTAQMHRASPCSFPQQCVSVVHGTLDYIKETRWRSRRNASTRPVAAHSISMPPGAALQLKSD